MADDGGAKLAGSSRLPTPCPSWSWAVRIGRAGWFVVAMVTDSHLSAQQITFKLTWIRGQQRAPPSWMQITASFHPPGLLTVLLLFLPFRSENETLSNAINSRHRQLRGPL